jgi:hypothetical protein
MKLIDITGKKVNVCMAKIMSMELTAQTQISETCTVYSGVARFFGMWGE